MGDIHNTILRIVFCHYLIAKDTEHYYLLHRILFVA